MSDARRKTRFPINPQSYRNEGLALVFKSRTLIWEPDTRLPAWAAVAGHTSVP